MSRRSVVVLGSTGSIGTQALDVLARNADAYEVWALSAGGANIELLVAQTLAFAPRLVAVAGEERAADFRSALAASTADPCYEPPRIVAGIDAATIAAGMGADVVLNGITGSVGLGPTLAALGAGSTLALANKESLVAGGPLVKAAAAPGQIVPVDSEHSALAQCLLGGDHREVRRLILTASGGPFRRATADQIAAATVEEALTHPTWAMGPVVTINSATMVNKGLEVIEAHLLFDIPLDRIDVVVHPQSMVHSMVEFVDGSTLLQASPPDMRLPIALGLSWPSRLSDVAEPCDWTMASTWRFEPLDDERFPAVRLARWAGESGGTAPAVYNAANEEAVAAFLSGNMNLPAIVGVVNAVVGEHLGSETFVAGTDLTLADVTEAEDWARAAARRRISARA